MKVDPGIDQLAINDLEKEVFLQKIIELGTKERYDAILLPMVSKLADVNIRLWSKLIETFDQQSTEKSGIILIPSHLHSCWIIYFQEHILETLL